MLRIALTGGIGSGKSTVADLFAAYGVPIIDADRLAHTLTAPGEPATTDIVAVFGPSVLNQDGALDRAALRHLVFRDQAARQRLEAILHPRIGAAIRSWLASVNAPYAILVIPLLLETGQQDLADRILVVDAPKALRIERVKARSGMAEDEIERVMAAQVTRSTRLAQADDLIDNSGDPARLADQVARLHDLYQGLSREWRTEGISPARSATNGRVERP
ncbi:dephospho-CoA kinase [Thioalkalicoccus limnaeus]|uniref:Dephospho-CoA kinase n=1 Tax=Thioalkalicoccus limnaeus TaxID=120681 RepID=A0ABV4BAI0_9GAMM